MYKKRSLTKVTAILLSLVIFGTLLPVFAYAALATPSLTGAVAQGTGIKVSWSEVSGASGYRVYRKSSGTGWTALGDTTGTSYKDSKAQEGVTYTYTVRAMSGGKVNSDYDKIGVSCAWTNSTASNLSTPELVSASAETNGIRVKWKKVTGATGYRIYRKTEKSGWSTLKDVADSDSYVDTTCTSGTAYIYTVRAMVSGKVRSDYQKDGVKATWDSGIAPGDIAAPELVSAVAQGKGLKVTWNSVSGASAYRVYRKTTGNWAHLVDVTGTSYQDNATKAGTKYSYTVRCLDSNAKVISSYDKTGVSGQWTESTTGDLPAPSLKSAKCGTAGVVITWDAVEGAASYRIYRKTVGTSWVRIGDTAGATTTYTDKTAKSGTVYDYTVRVRDAGGAIVSGYDTTGVSCAFYSSPSLLSATAESGGVRVKWKEVGGALKYLVYRKTGSGSFSRLTTSEGTEILDASVDYGNQYTYTVRVISYDGKELLSDYNHTGISVFFAGKAGITDLTNVQNGVRISWTAVAGATDYNVYRKTGEGGWTLIANVTASPYTDTAAVNNTTHTYRVRAINSGTPIGSDDTDGISITHYVPPTLSGCVRQSDGLLTTWEAVEGISNYVIYRKLMYGSDWVRIGTSATTSYLDTSAPSGTFSEYAVSCADASGNAVSAYKGSVGTTTYMDKPVLGSAVCVDGGITITWNKVDKATGYRIFVKTGEKTNYDPVTIVGDVSSYTYTTGLVTGKTYTFTVATSDGSQDMSEYNATGISATYYPVPVLKTIENAATGVKITWDAVDGIGSYRIYRKTGSSGWTAIGTSGSTSYIDTDVKTNGHYEYSVSCLNNSVETSGYADPGISGHFFAPPTVTGISSSNGKITISWNPVEGISAYNVYRKAGNAAWQLLTSSGVSGTSYEDSASITSGTIYTYTVRCLAGGKVVSDYNTTVKTTYLSAPTGVNVDKVNKKLTWSAVTGAKTYTVYRKTALSSWEAVATSTDGAYFTDTKAQSGVTYTYRIYAVANDDSRSAPADVNATFN